MHVFFVVFFASSPPFPENSSTAALPLTPLPPPGCVILDAAVAWLQKKLELNTLLCQVFTFLSHSVKQLPQFGRHIIMSNLYLTFSLETCGALKWLRLCFYSFVSVQIWEAGVWCRVVWLLPELPPHRDRCGVWDERRHRRLGGRRFLLWQENGELLRNLCLILDRSTFVWVHTTSFSSIYCFYRQFLHMYCVYNTWMCWKLCIFLGAYCH